MEALQDAKFTFDDFELDCAKRQLKRDGEPVALKSKTFDLLQHLVENSGRLVTKSELMERVWPDQFVEENNLTVQISALRKVFGQGQFITTVPGKGYKFVADVAEVAAPEELIIEQRSFSRITIEEHSSVTKPAPERSLSGSVGSRLVRPFAAFAIGFILLIAVMGFVYWERNSGYRSENYALSKVTASGDITSATITPDGGYSVFARKEVGGESLWLRHLAAGTQQQILAVKPVRFVGLAVTPDGTSIYATTFSPSLPDPEIWKLPLTGGEINVLQGPTTGAAVSFSADGKRIAFTESRSSMKETQLLIANADGSEKRIVSRAEDDKRSFPNFNSQPAAWSPDGRSIACAVAEKSLGLRYGILLVDPDTGNERYVSEKRWDLIDSVTWLNDDEITFIGYSVEPWQGQIWAVSRRSGAVRRLTNDLSSYSWLAAGGGKMITVHQNAVSHITLANFDTSANIGSQKEILSESGGVDNLSFASAGELLYSSNASGKRELWQMKFNGTDAKQITSNSDAAFGMCASPVDGSIVFGAFSNGKYFLKMTDADGRNPRLLTDGPDDLNPSFTPDGRTVVFQKGLNNRTITAWKISLNDKKQTQLTQTTAIHPVISPDGSKVAYYFMDQAENGIWKIGFISTIDGSLLGKLSFPKPVTERHMRWMPDGTAVGQIVNEGDRIDLLVMPINGELVRTISGIAKGDVLALAWSPDGQRLAIASADVKPDVVLLSRQN